MSFNFFLEGDVSIEIAGRVFPLRYGDVILIPPGTPHRPYIRDSKTPYRRFVFWVTGEYLNQMMETSVAYGYLMQYVRTKGVVYLSQ